MHPAFSVIFFSTLSGAGYGLLAIVAALALHGASPGRLLLVLLPLALALVSIGLLSSLAHLGKPQRAWRAVSQWRTSWLSREGVVALLTYLPALGLGAALLPAALDGTGTAPAALGLAGVVAALLAITGAMLTVTCTAMIYASLPPIPAWRHRLVVPGYLLFALLTGAALAAAGAAWAGAFPAVGLRILAALVALAAAAAIVLKLRYWRAIDATPLAQSRGDALGLSTRTASVFERPHTEANYLTREMGYVLARRHGARLRQVALWLFGVLPLALALAALVVPAAAPFALVFAATCALPGVAVERWLFFAQARHLVTLYY
ncbi:dimethyl sulfoxide reductase anchor subunit family protein [Lysobacter sp. A3-1-A15]|uniref:dimethyl sulfoxide reductase anchor subunit family protein n=1 Tax=Novilysobacter viscosus TaxID=3098602 RepID=UPI002ED93FFC